MKLHIDHTKLFYHNKLVRNEIGESIRYTINGVLHNPNGPAIVRSHDGKLLSEYYYINGKKHNSKGPSRIVYHLDGSPLLEEYYIHDKLHRTDGPAVISYSVHGEVVGSEYHINGIRICREEFDYYINCINIKDRT